MKQSCMEINSRHSPLGFSMFLESDNVTFENISKEFKLSGPTIIQDWETNAYHKIYSSPAIFILTARLQPLCES